MLTTTVDGLWVLQILAGIETVAPEIGLRPILPSVETPQLALAHPIAAELREAGVIDEAGTVDPVVVEWLTVLARRDVALVIHMRMADGDVMPDRAVLARFAQWWVVIERSQELIRISGAGTSTTESAANNVILGQIERLCGSAEPAQLQPVTVDVDKVMNGVSDRDGIRQQLLRTPLDGHQLQVLMMAADVHRSARAFIVAVQSGVEYRRTYPHSRRAECGDHRRYPGGPVGRRALPVRRQAMDGHRPRHREQYRRRGEPDGSPPARQSRMVFLPKGSVNSGLAIMLASGS